MEPYKQQALRYIVQTIARISIEKGYCNSISEFNEQNKMDADFILTLPYLVYCGSKNRNIIFHIFNTMTPTRDGIIDKELDDNKIETIFTFTRNEKYHYITNINLQESSKSLSLFEACVDVTPEINAAVEYLFSYCAQFNLKLHTVPSSTLLLWAKWSYAWHLHQKFYRKYANTIDRSILDKSFFTELEREPNYLIGRVEC